MAWSRSQSWDSSLQGTWEGGDATLGCPRHLLVRGERQNQAKQAPDAVFIKKNNFEDTLKICSLGNFSSGQASSHANATRLNIASWTCAVGCTPALSTDVPKCAQNLHHMLFLSTDLLILARGKTTCQQQPRQESLCLGPGLEVDLPSWRGISLFLCLSFPGLRELVAPGSCLSDTS